MAEFKTFPCPECGAMVLVTRMTAHQDEHEALALSLQLLGDAIVGLQAQLTALTAQVGQVNGQTP